MLAHRHKKQLTTKKSHARSQWMQRVCWCWAHDSHDRIACLHAHSAEAEFAEMYEKHYGSGYSLCEKKLHLSIGNCSLLASNRTKAQKTSLSVVLPLQVGGSFCSFPDRKCRHCIFILLVLLSLNTFPEVFLKCVICFIRNALWSSKRKGLKRKCPLHLNVASQRLWLRANDTLKDVSW